MTLLITFALANFPLTFTILGLIVAGVEILRTPQPRSPGSSAKAVLRWFMFFGIGVTYLYNFVCHVFFGEQIAQFIGWEQSPFQAEVGWASLGYAVLGFMSFRPHRALRVGTIAAVACFMWGAASGHIYQIVTAHNLAPGNAGGMLWYDVLLPLFGFFLLWKARAEKAL